MFSVWYWTAYFADMISAGETNKQLLDLYVNTQYVVRVSSAEGQGIIQFFRHVLLHLARSAIAGTPSQPP